MLDHWPSGSRDTTEFPKLVMNVEADFREHLGAFCRLGGVGWSDYEAQEKVFPGREPQRLRSYRKMYERLGLVYQDGDEIRLSPLGREICEIETRAGVAAERVVREIKIDAVRVLIRYQLDNPTESDRADLPSNCDVRPFLCIWRAMLELDGKLHVQEMNRVILRVMTMADLPAAIDLIRAARLSESDYAAADETTLLRLLGEPVHTGQPEARIGLLELRQRYALQRPRRDVPEHALRLIDRREHAFGHPVV